MEKRLRVIGLCRVSTEEQATNGQSLGVQRDKIEGYAKLYDLNLVRVIVDAGVSAKTLDRPGLQEALAKLRKGEADGLVIAKLDRLTRSVGDWQELIDDYFGEKAGKQLFSVSDCIDTRTAAGRLVLNVLLSVAQWEREAIGERTKEVLGAMRKRHMRISRHTPYGRNLEEGGHLSRNAQEGEVIKRMVTMRREGLTFRAIAAELNAGGVPPKRGTTWLHTSVRSILCREM